MDANIQTQMDMCIDPHDLFWAEVTGNDFNGQTDPLQMMCWTDPETDLEEQVQVQVYCEEERKSDDKPHTTPVELRQQVIQLREQKALTFAKIAAMLNLKVTTVKTIWQVYHREKRVAPLQGGGWDRTPGRETVARRITGPIYARVVELHASKNSLRSIARHILEEYGVRISRSSYGALLQRLRAARLMCE